MNEVDDINTLIQTLNLDSNGSIDTKKLKKICPNLTQDEIDIICDELKHVQNDENYLKELIQSSNDSRKLQKQDAIDHEYNIDQNIQINEIFNHLECQEQIYEFYEALRNVSQESVEHFQSILEIFVTDILKHRKEIKRLEDSYKREKEIHEKYLRTIEEDQERDMNLLQEKIRQEERQKFDIERELIQQRTNKEINEFNEKIQRLQIVNTKIQLFQIEKLYIERKNDETSLIHLLREDIAKLTEENRTLNSTLTDSLTTNAILESDLQSIRSQLTERQTMLLQEKQSSSSNVREKESLQINVRQLVEVNKQLRDENDSLRALIESKKSTKTLHISSPKRLTSTAGSTLGIYWNSQTLDSPSPSYITSPKQHKFDSFDLDSTDDLGIIGNGIKIIENLNPVSSSTSLPFAVIPISNEKRIMNDSGLSLTTGRDATEVESDPEVHSKNIISTRHVQPNRSLKTKHINDDTDSDDVFVEISFDRTNSKRSSQQRSTKRGTHGNFSSKHINTMSQSIKHKTQSPSFDKQHEQPFDRMFKVVFCGDAAVGKTTLIMRLCKDRFVSNINSTLGVDFQNKEINIDGKHVAIQLWDTAGQERFRSIAKSYFRRCDGVILVYDSTYERSFLNVREWIDTITDATSKRVSILIVANKIDLREQTRAEKKRVIEKCEGLKLAKEYNALFIETSAKDGTNSNEILVELARDMQCNEDLERFRMAGVNLSTTSKKTICCGN